MGGKAKQQPVDKIEELRQATREANEALAGIRDALREIRSIQLAMPSEIRSLIDKEVNVQLKDYIEGANKEISKRVNETVNSLSIRLERLTWILNNDKQTFEPSIEDLLLTEGVIRYITDVAQRPAALSAVVNKWRKDRAARKD